MRRAATRSVQMKSDFDVGLNCHGMAVEHRRFEFPLLDCLDGFFLETHAERTYRADSARPAIGSDYDPEQDRSLDLSIASLFGIVRIGIVDCTRCRHSTTDAIQATTRAAARSWAKTWSVSFSDSPAAAAPASAPGLICRCR